MAIVTAHTADIFSALKIGVLYADILNRSFAESKQTDIFCSVIIEIQAANGVILSVKCTGVFIVKISNGYPISPAVCLCAVTAGDIANVGGDIRCEDSVCTAISCVIIAHFVCKPVQLTGVADLVVFSCLVQRCRLIVGAVLGAETVFVKVMNRCCVLVVGIAVSRRIFCRSTVFYTVNHAVALIQNRKSVCVLAA